MSGHEEGDCSKQSEQQCERHESQMISWIVRRTDSPQYEAPEVSEYRIEVINFPTTRTCVKCIHHWKLIIEIKCSRSNSCTLLKYRVAQKIGIIKLAPLLYA